MSKPIHVKNQPLVVGRPYFPTAYNKLVKEMGGVSWRGGSQEVTRLTITTRLKMEDGYSLCNVIEIFLPKKSNQDRKKRAF